MTRSRLGVVLPIPDLEATEIDGLRRALGDPALTWIPPHVTLVPPVNVRDDQLQDVISIVRSAAADTAEMRLEIGPLATFWPDTPVLYLGVGGDVDAVRRIRDRVLVGSFARPAEWPFIPHVTVGQDIVPALIQPALQVMRAYRRTVAIDRVHLLRQADERRWEVIADLPLGGGRTVGRGGLEVELVSSDVLDLQAAEFLRRTVTGSTQFAVSARREGRLAGVAVGRTDGTELTLDRLVVDAATRLQGVGGQLLREVELVGAARGCTVATAVVADGGDGQAWLAGRGWRRADHDDRPDGRRVARMTRALG